MPDDAELRQIFQSVRVIAIVGLSSRLDRASHPIAYYLQSLGYRIIPVNPNATTSRIIGEKVYPNLSAIPDRVDLVQVFRKPEAVVPVVQEAIQVGAKIVWLQLGIANRQAAQLAQAAGIQFVASRCMLEEHLRLFGRPFVS
jgi:uncharacterized protein